MINCHPRGFLYKQVMLMKPIYCAISGQLDRSNRFTHRPLANLFIPTQTRLLLEAFSHVVINARRLFVHIYAPLPTDRYSCIQLSELWQCIVNEIVQASKWKQVDLSLSSLHLESDVQNTILLHHTKGRHGSE